MMVTRLGYGGFELRGPRIGMGRSLASDEAETILNRVLDVGINFIDTAYDYGCSEASIGRYISHRRDEYHLATKCGCTLVDRGSYDETPHVWTGDNLEHNIDVSLRRMKTDHVDLWQLHNPTPEQVREGDLVEVMQRVRQKGKARHIGISTTLPHLRAFLDWDVFETFQLPYSALEREHEEAIGLVAKAGAGTVIRGGVARGEPGEGMGKPLRWALWQQTDLDELLEEGMSRTQFMLRFTLSHPDVHSVIVGTSDSCHLSANAEAAEAGPLPAAVYEEAVRRLNGAANFSVPPLNS